jgi:hypothetical protein
MNYLEECLTLGGWLSEEDRLALYKYFLECNSETYEAQVNFLLANGTFSKRIANGEISYFLKGRKINYSARKFDSDEYTREVREIKLIGPRFIDLRRLKKFFAQSDVDVIRNFPLPGANPQSDSGYGITVYPYYDLRYYSNNRSRLIGFFRKLKIDDSELINKLRAL